MLQVERLTTGYGAVDVLHDVSISVPTGAAVAILGANGAGKTTLLRALTGQLRSRVGSMTLNNERLDRVTVEGRVRRGMALVPEGRELFGSLSVRENLVMGAFTRRSHREMEADIAQVLSYFPRLQQRLAVPAASLSGGEGQMLAIGRALMSRPRILLLDEPSHGLAPAVVDTVFDVIGRLGREQGLTILLVEQNARKALSIASMAYVLFGGTVGLQGDTASLAQNDAVRALYLGGDVEDSAQATSPVNAPAASTATRSSDA